MAGPGEGNSAAHAAGRGRLRASHADREQLIGVLKAAFVQGRLTKDELDARIGQTFTARTYAELSAVAADLPAGLAEAGSPRRMPQPPAGHARRWGAYGLVTPGLVAVAFVFASLRGGDGVEAVALLIAFGYFVFWLSAGANMFLARLGMSTPATGIAADARTSPRLAARQRPPRRG